MSKQTSFFFGRRQGKMTEVWVKREKPMSKRNKLKEN
jgi:hypothetical protein